MDHCSPEKVRTYAPGSKDAKRLRNLRDRVQRARHFPDNTCAASRHLHMMADALASGREYFMFREEPQHCAESILAVLESLWKIRTASPEYRAQVERAVAAIAARDT
jgi:hypothetical protein